MWNKIRHYLEGYAIGFSIFPTGSQDDPNEDVRRAWQETGDALREAMGVVEQEIRNESK